jgi:hypothetical protein
VRVQAKTRAPQGRTEQERHAAERDQLRLKVRVVGGGGAGDVRGERAHARAARAELLQ